MAERDPKQLAERFVATSLRCMIVPPDDMWLNSESDDSRVQHNLGEFHRLEEFRPIVDELPISTFFHDYLLDQLHRSAAEGFRSQAVLMQTITDDYGIRLDDDDFGFCDPTKSLRVEKGYFFNKALPHLTFMERMGEFTPVDWAEWAVDVNRRSMESTSS